LATNPGVTILQRHLGMEVVVEFVEDGEVRGGALRRDPCDTGCGLPADSRMVAQSSSAQHVTPVHLCGGFAPYGGAGLAQANG
jgi:hypothetical protein